MPSSFLHTFHECKKWTSRYVRYAYVSNGSIEDIRT
jgi:hypothetical protein